MSSSWSIHISRSRISQTLVPVRSHQESTLQLSYSVSLFDVYDVNKRKQVVAQSARGELDVRGHIPNGEEEAVNHDSGDESDEEKDQLDIMKVRQYGMRKSTRKRAAPKPFGGSYTINPSQVDMLDESGQDSDANGMQ